MNTTTIARTTVAAGLVALALSACGTEQPAPATQEVSVVHPKVEGIGSADAVERRMGLSDFTMVGTPDSLERQLAAASSPAPCHVSADTAERLGAAACGR